MSQPPDHNPDAVDDHVDDEIAACLNLEEPRSFFLFAGAGSGKTRSLVKALMHLRDKYGAELRLRGQRIAVITYTNAACDEITRRLEFDPVIFVSTIHSFAWTIIQGLTRDIREWLRTKLAEDIVELRGLEARGRAGTKASATRIAQIASKTRRLERLDSIRKFIYSPTGDNRGRDALSHSEVIKLAAYFIENKPAMQSLLVGGYPVLLIDESQDTSKYLIDALFALQAQNAERFSLGLLGDMMQRIYADGKEGLGTNLPADWAVPAKRMNHRCPQRVVRLINKIREPADNQQQQARSDSIEGHVRMFVLPADTADKPGIERAVTGKMAQVTGEQEWERDNGVKRLILEHRMAATRMGFLDMFVPLYEFDDFRTGLLDGSLPVTRLFANSVLPLVERQNDRFAVAKIVRAASPLLDGARLQGAEQPEVLLQQAREAVASLLQICNAQPGPTFGDVLRNIGETGLFEIPDALRATLVRDQASITQPDDPDETDWITERNRAVDAFLGTPFQQIAPYAAYVTGAASFDTHQGVKGLQFPRVMVIMDDTEARGFSFKYEKLFGGGPGEDTTSATTRRLFYVTCSRTERGLALVAYSSSPESTRNYVLRQGWFEENEVQLGVG